MATPEELQSQDLKQMQDEYTKLTGEKRLVKEEMKEILSSKQDCIETIKAIEKVTKYFPGDKILDDKRAECETLDERYTLLNEEKTELISQIDKIKCEISKRCFASLEQEQERSKQVLLELNNKLKQFPDKRELYWAKHLSLKEQALLDLEKYKEDIGFYRLEKMIADKKKELSVSGFYCLQSYKVEIGYDVEKVIPVPPDDIKKRDETIILFNQHTEEVNNQEKYASRLSMCKELYMEDVIACVENGVLNFEELISRNIKICPNCRCDIHNSETHCNKGCSCAGDYSCKRFY